MKWEDYPGLCALNPVEYIFVRGRQRKISVSHIHTPGEGNVTTEAETGMMQP